MAGRAAHPNQGDTRILCALKWARDSSCTLGLIIQSMRIAEAGANNSRAPAGRSLALTWPAGGQLIDSPQVLAHFF